MSIIGELGREGVAYSHGRARISCRREMISACVCDGEPMSSQSKSAESIMTLSGPGGATDRGCDVRVNERVIASSAMVCSPALTASRIKSCGST